MNYLTQLFNQARGLFMSMTPGSRVLAGLMLTAILVSTVFLVRDTQTVDMEYLFGGRAFKDGELQQAEMAMSNASLRDYKRDGNRIKIPTEKKDLYLKALADGKVLHQDLGGSVAQALASGNFLEPMMLTKTRIHAARERDIADAIARLPFVENVYVTYDEKREGFSAQAQSTASVFVMPKYGVPLDDQKKRSIMQQVKAAFAGLKYENISIMDQSSGISMRGEDDPNSSQQQKYYQQKAQVEQSLRQKAKNLLADYGDVRFEVNVELDPILREEVEMLKYADKPVTVQTTSSKRDSEMTKTSTGGKPGTEPNAISNRSTSLNTTPDQNSRNKEQQESERKIVGQETTLTERAGLVIKNATFSVSIPFSYYGLAWKRQWQELNPGKALTDAPAMTPSEFTQLKKDIGDKIQVLLTAILPPLAPGTDPLPRVSVTDYLDMPVEAIPGPSTVNVALGWLATQWQTIATFVLAIIVLMSVRSFAMTNTAVDDSAFDRGFDIPIDEAADIDLASLAGGTEAYNASVAAAGGSEAGAAGADGQAGGGSRFPTTGGDIRQQLTNLVRENPDAAATALRSWIGASV